ncbi:hypothetical protein LINPERHAP1_LOCUS16232, partial [Linum perenne]
AISFDNSVLPIWVKLKNVPLEYYSELGLSRISSLLGILLWMDIETRCGSQLGFAKICVEISYKFSFPDMISFLSDEGILFDVEVEYCNAPSVCSSCSKFGHKSCAKKAEVKEDPQIPKSDAKVQSEVKDPQPSSDATGQTPKSVEKSAGEQVVTPPANSNASTSMTSRADDEGFQKVTKGRRIMVEQSPKDTSTIITPGMFEPLVFFGSVNSD